jgi:predicted SAM-dependent methyltransferase
LLPPESVKLNIGAGRTYIPGFTNIDLTPQADVSLNLSEEPLPFGDDSVDLIFSHHTLEHIPDYLFALSEIHRVLKHNGLLLIGVPYVTLTEYNLVNPYHLHHFNEHSFSFFDPAKRKGSAMESNAIWLKQVTHRLHYMGRFNHLPAFLQNWCRRHLFNVVRKIDFALVAVKNNGPLEHPDAGALMHLFDQCLKARKPYGR